jgi:hypothetical protein
MDRPGGCPPEHAARPNHFVCACCLRTFGKARSDEEAFERAEADLGVPIDRTRADPVCPDCWQEYLDWIALQARSIGWTPPTSL